MSLLGQESENAQITALNPFAFSWRGTCTHSFGLNIRFHWINS